MAYGLYCLLFTVISASLCFAQDDDVWGNYPDYSYDEDDDPFSDSGFPPEDNFYDAAGPSAVSVEDSTVDSAAVSAATAIDEAVGKAEAAADKAAKAADKAEAAARQAVSASANASSPPAPPQPPVRIIIPMTTGSVPPPAPNPPVYNLPPIKVIPAMPNPNGNTVHRVQVGAFGNAGLAQQCFNRLCSAGFSPVFEPEPYRSLKRIVLPGIKAADMAVVVQRLAAAGFNEVWIREDK